MAANTSKHLTDGQQGVIAMYDKEIAHFKAQRDAAYGLYLSSDGHNDYTEFSHLRDKVAEIEAERADVLAGFLEAK